MAKHSCDWRSLPPPLADSTHRLLELALTPGDAALSEASSGEEPTWCQHLLVRLIVDRDALGWHIRCLQRLRQLQAATWPAYQLEPLPPEQVQQVLDRGVSAIDAARLPRLLLNPVALQQLAESVDEALPDEWLKPIQEHGSELQASSDSDRPPCSVVASSVPTNALAHATVAAKLDQDVRYRRAFERMASLAACVALLLVGAWFARQAAISRESAALHESPDAPSTPRASDKGVPAPRPVDDEPLFAIIPDQSFPDPGRKSIRADAQVVVLTLPNPTSDNVEHYDVVPAVIPPSGRPAPVEPTKPSPGNPFS